MVLGTVLAALAGHLTSVSAQRFTIFTANHVWKYKFDSVYVCQDGQSPAWETTAFDDSSWLSGPGGFTGGETRATALIGVNTTTLPAPVAAGIAGKRANFRTHFNIVSTAGVSLTFSNRIDDNAAFFLNGTLLPLNHRATGGTACTAFGGGAIGPNTDAEVWETLVFTPTDLAGILVVGDNVLAASVGQVNATSSDLVFVCELYGDIASAPINLTPLQPANVSLPQCATLTLSGSFSGSPAPTYQWYYEGSAMDGVANPSALTPTLTIANVGLINTGHYKLRASNANGMTETREATVTITADLTPPHVVSATTLASNANYILLTFDEPVDGMVFDPFGVKVSARNDTSDLGDTAAAGFQVNPTTIIVETTGARLAGVNYKIAIGFDSIKDVCAGNSIAAVTVNVATEVLLTDKDSATDLWSYDESGTDMGTAWREVNFDASAWPTGPAFFGLETAGNVQGVIRTPWTVSAKITYYLRKSANLPAPPSQVDRLTLVQEVDDGCVTYINGVEADRYGLAAAAPLDYLTFFASPAEPQPLTSTNLAVTGLIEGHNVIAVEVHQTSAASSDILYGSRLSAICRSVYPGVTMTRSGSTVTVSWTEYGINGKLQTSGDLVAWTTDGRAPTHVGGTYSLTYTLPGGAGHLYIRLLQ